MKAAIAIALALILGGCASGPYYAGYSGYDDGLSRYDPYGYDGYNYYGGYGPNEYGYGYGSPYYGYPGILGGSLYYDRHDDDRGWGDRRDYRDRRQGRGPGERGTWQEGNDARHGEAGNEAGMGRARGAGSAARGRGEAGNEAR